MHRPARLPIERCPGTRHVWPALGDPICGPYVFDDVAEEVGESKNGELVAVAVINRSRLA